MKRYMLGAVGAALLAGCGGSSSPTAAVPDPAKCVVSGTETDPPPIEHVFVIVLENKGFDETYGPGSPAKYLTETLVPQGQLLTQFHGTSHASTGNYIAMISGQGPNPATHADCINFEPWKPLDGDGKALTSEYAQAIGKGCVYPANIPTLMDEMDTAGLSWKGWMEDMQFELQGNPDRHPDRPKAGTPAASCIQPQISETSIDQTNLADETEQYAARHNSFLFFETIIGAEETPQARARCDANVLDLEHLRTALQSRTTTQNYNLIVPDNCRNAHDAECADGGAGGLERADEFLRDWVPVIMASPAYREAGMLVILFDEANFTPHTDPDAAAACCGQESHPGPNTVLPGLFGPGGGRFGALVLSKYTTPGSTNDTPYNHFSFLRTLENLYGLNTIDLDAKPDDGYLGYAGLPAEEGMKAFGEDVYNCGG
ncbi:MAG: alkaline phosphatase family protein [Gammaproteobacteria bacterium]